MRVLLTGASGWLGRFLAPLLRAAGHRVVGLDVAPGPDTDVVGSVADPEAVGRTFGLGVDAVVHAGGLHRPDLARHPAQAFVDVNVTGTLNLLRAAVAAGAGRLVFTSTTSHMVRSRRHARGHARAAAPDDAATAMPIRTVRDRMRQPCGRRT